MSAPAIQVTDLCKNYGPVVAVDHVSFEVATGELVGFLGLNGAGKTTTMRILTTFMPASSGIAKVAGYDVMYESMDVRRNLGYLPESVPLYPEMRVQEYLESRAKLKGVERTARTARIDYCIERCRIREVRRRVIGTLSKGYRQRVGLADALISMPKVLILDEPLSGLDPIQQEESLQTIRELSGQHSVLFSSHQLTDVEKVCDRVIIIHRGRLEFDDRLSTIAARAAVLFLEVRGPSADVQSFLQKAQHVTSVQVGASEGPYTTFVIRSDTDNREALVSSLVEKGWGIRRVDQRREKLEDTFMRVAYQRA